MRMTSGDGYASGGSVQPTFTLGSMTFTGSPTPTADDLRAQAKRIEKADRKRKARAKAAKAQAKRQANDRETVRLALLRVVQDESKGYASVEAAEALSTLGFI